MKNNSINSPNLFCTLPSQSCLPTIWTISYNLERYLGCLPVPSTSCYPEPYPGVCIHISTYSSIISYLSIDISTHIYLSTYHIISVSILHIVYVSISHIIYVSICHIMIPQYIHPNDICNDVCTCYICIYIPLNLSPRASQIYQYRLHTYITSPHSLLIIYLM